MCPPLEGQDCLAFTLYIAAPPRGSSRVSLPTYYVVRPGGSFYILRVHILGPSHQ